MPGQPHRLPHGPLTVMRVPLLGHPVAHSVSPAMQNAAFDAMGMGERYEAVDVPAEALAEAVRELRQEEFMGAQVTVPHKVAVIEFLDELDPLAETTGAVNTIVNDGRRGRLVGHNTDVEGAWKGLLEPVADDIGGARVVIAGAGGGARAVVVALERAIHRAPGLVLVVARNQAQAAEVAELGSRRGLSIGAAAWAQLSNACDGAGVVINCTPLGLYGEDPFDGIALTGRAVLDLAYAPGGTPLVQRARAEKATSALEGDEMLLHQGVQAFWLWTHEEPPIKVMRAALQEALK
jgi:shikimate dehydrogenase